MLATMSEFDVKAFQQQIDVFLLNEVKKLCKLYLNFWSKPRHACKHSQRGAIVSKVNTVSLHFQLNSLDRIASPASDHLQMGNAMAGQSCLQTHSTPETIVLSIGYLAIQQCPVIEVG